MVNGYGRVEKTIPDDVAAVDEGWEGEEVIEMLHFALFC